LICAWLVEEDLAMSDRVPAPEDADDQGGSKPDVVDTDEFAKMRAVMRAQERHREGGVDPELEDGIPTLVPELGQAATGVAGAGTSTTGATGGP
jgi:hypothetical protein